MAAFYVQELRRLQPSGPYAFLGFSFGGLVAYEMAQQLVASGERVQFLGMLDTWQPSYLKRVKAVQPWPMRALGRLNLVRLNTRKLSLVQMVPYTYVRLKSRVLRVAYRGMGNAGPVSLPDSMRRARDINLMAASRYKVRPYPGQVSMFRAKDEALDLPEDLAWRSYAGGGVEIFRLPGDHGQILAEPNLSFMAARIENCLTRRVKIEREEFELDADGVVPLGTPMKAAE
jgi:aspartate racemase